eukprot:CAMPEP_0174887804 /NCGR_PEP_ID=MMETSP0167-20121228/3026_1 /TAXON_ID=38298 /ORGANISM="Rhodella maculata, Strain CCMP736" /LENGTH=133 /DNA_ID=CAMNT_0016124445 /DNA_START=138 /DNA_END=535 /DNA_ORIENTATION=+
MASNASRARASRPSTTPWKIHREVGHMISVEKVISHDGHSKRPGDHYEEESKTCVDVSIVHVKSSASLLYAAKIQLYAEDKAHQGKMSKSLQKCESKGLKFRCRIMETYGACHKEVKVLIRPIANAHVQRSAV